MSINELQYFSFTTRTPHVDLKCFVYHFGYIYKLNNLFGRPYAQLAVQVSSRRLHIWWSPQYIVYHLTDRYDRLKVGILEVKYILPFGQITYSNAVAVKGFDSL